MEPTVILTILGLLIVIVFFLGAPIKPIRLISQSIVKLVIGAFFLFFLNILGNQFDIHVPINFITTAISGFLGIPGLAALVAIDMWII